MFQTIVNSASNQRGNVNSQNQHSLQKQKAIQQLKSKQQSFEKFIDYQYQKIEDLNSIIKEHISSGKKDVAKGFVGEMKMIQKQIAVQQQKVNLIIKMIIDIECMDQDKGLTDLIGEVTNLFKNKKFSEEQITSGLESWQDTEVAQIERIDIFNYMEKQLVSNEGVDEELQQYEQELELDRLTRLLNTVPNQSINAVKVSKPVHKNTERVYKQMN